MSDLEEFERHQASLLNMRYEDLKTQFDHNLKVFGNRYAVFSDFEKEWELWQAAWKARQSEIDQLKTELDLCRDENKGLVGSLNKQRKHHRESANKLTQKSIRLTDAEFEYKRIKGLQAKDCLQIMRLTARNEKLCNELKALRGEHE